MSLPRYGEYKESGVPWLGAIPSHWELHPTKRHFQRRKELNAGMACEYRLALTMNGVVPRSLGDLDGLQSSDYEGYQIFEPGDLAFKLIDLQNIKTSRVGLVQERGIMSPAYIRLQPRRTTVPRYAYWYFMALYWTQVFNSLGGGVRQTLGPEELLTVEYPVPTLFEQTAIAAFLDREIAKIDALIAEQEKLIALLFEKRQATISHSVTRGLAPDTPMRDSDVAWLGEVPAHWGVCPLKRIARIGNGSTPNRDNPDYWADEGFPWLNSSVVNQEEVSEAERFVTALALKECHLPVVEPPAVLVGITGQGKTRGMATRLAFTATLNQHLAYIKPAEDLLSESYLLRVFEAVYQHLRTESEGAGSTKGAITCEQLGNLRIPVPELAEQLAIATFLDREIAKLDKLKLDSQRGIALLKERRSALIAAAVTGQIDVRQA